MCLCGFSKFYHPLLRRHIKPAIQFSQRFYGRTAQGFPCLCFKPRTMTIALQNHITALSNSTTGMSTGGRKRPYRILLPDNIIPFEKTDSHRKFLAVSVFCRVFLLLLEPRKRMPYPHK